MKRDVLIPFPLRGSGGAVVLVVLVVAVFFANSLVNGFTYDDQDMIVRNLVIRSLGNLGKIFSTPWWWGGPRQMTNEYRPLTVLSFAVNYFLDDLRPFLFHLVNVVVHLGVSLLIFFLVKGLFESYSLALLTALLFAAHPVHTEPINNIVGRAELLAAFFSILCLLLYCHYHKRWVRQSRTPIKSKSKDSQGKRWLLAFYYLAIPLAYLLAMFSKETAIPIIVVFLLIDLINWQCPGKRGQNGHPAAKELVGQVGKVWPIYGGLAIALIIYFAFRIKAVGGIISSEVHTSFMDNVLMLARQQGDMVAYYLTVLKAFGIYLSLLILPIKLSPDYSYNQISVSYGLFESAVVLSFLALIVLVALGYWGIKKREYPVFFSVLFFFITYSVVSNFLVTIGTLLGERLIYLPSLGYCLLLAFGLIKLFKPETLKRSSLPALVVISAVIIGLYGVKDVVRNSVWRDDFTLFLSAVKTSPNCARVHYNLGEKYLRIKKDYDKAEQHFWRSYEIAPNYGAPLSCIGEILYTQKKYDQAIELFKKVIAMEYRYHPAHHNLGLVYMAQRKWDEAIAAFKRAIQIRPTLAEPYYNIGKIHMLKGELGEAERYLLMALKLEPRLYPGYTLLGELYEKMGQPEKALVQYQAAVAIEPQNSQGHFLLANLLAQLGENDRARAEFESSIKLSPDWAEPYLGLAKLYLLGYKDYQRALYHFQQVLKIDPNHPLREKILNSIRELEEKVKK